MSSVYLDLQQFRYYALSIKDMTKNFIDIVTLIHLNILFVISSPHAQHHHRDEHHHNFSHHSNPSHHIIIIDGWNGISHCVTNPSYYKTQQNYFQTPFLFLFPILAFDLLLQTILIGPFSSDLSVLISSLAMPRERLF